MISRKTFAATAAVLALALVGAPASAQVGGSAIKSMLGQASDSALDQLSKPGAFSADQAIAIALPGGKGVGDLMNLASKAGLTGDINGSLNRAAEQAAAQAKPIFRAAIDKATLNDAVGALRGDTGATDYLKKSTGPEIAAQLKPLVQAALQSSGVLKQTSQLSALGFNDAKLTDYVTGKTSDGIFTYVGREETKMRQNPLETGKNLLQGMKGLKF
ncbi:DUF4197 family protein [Xylophilus rhododendri]|uniref:DUF4197 family protein n=1 Tax=Xylophilus rhododendri TaxID=2697032 RepID=A0A857J6M0_9BURK|nr:DUF4197 domain-containing protein [Xylophilus rhododendri]QHI98671.1 DUF4197 family protein [Xylophilus rhododendri]